MKKLLITAFALLLAAPVFAVDKKEIAIRYRGKFFQVKKDGLAVGICRVPSLRGGAFGTVEIAHMDVVIEGGTVKYKTNLTGSGLFSACVDVAAEPLAAGELVEVVGATGSKGELRLYVRNVDAHDVERGTGTGLEHVNKEHGYAMFKFRGAKDEDLSNEVDQWLTLFDNQKEAAKFGGAAVVKQVKLGMNTSEVESALGPPETRVDLESKLLYKYKDMTVEFHDGKVTDVR